ncbi:hypothetical protein [Clostridium sp. Cult2]|uniref:hypothetical protein n=1 Tax=Clostridium sp. Cult2 TaxID=2079003 RepID=UPI001F451D79|nr:hypothetical protein [Clostridium sp. Cult2]MCF6466367.1 hypothetical protein [Clostridium sp. Cult2]
MKKYPLLIQEVAEFEGCSVMAYYSKGHHNKEEFINAVMGDYDYVGNIHSVRHTNIKLSPSPTGGMMVNYRKEPCKGSFPATVIEV